ncbi:hypothetical protein GOBAR_AA01659 [Gossypium barbadense]|uniref:Uncharacterized protein n=1 Tax=Gossypium barbadense TaxID=3634 RepID=A0A2P5YTJ6_GOSBA|nr:hypothetical protein GOBAR_AA01659 [Gossypium barbadense]
MTNLATARSIIDVGKGELALREIPRKYVMEPQSNSFNTNRTSLEERRLQIEELDKWLTQVKKKPRVQREPKLIHDKPTDETNQFKVGDKVLLDDTDPHITNSELNRTIPFTILNVFPYGTVEVTHTDFDTFKVNST